MAGKRKNVVKFRKKPRAAMIIFTIILIYLIAFAGMYLSKTKVKTYEVETGSLTSNSSYTGIALRSEKVYNSAYSGNINYYLREGVKAKVGDTIYTVDETGRVSDLLSNSNSDENTLSDANLKVIKTTLNNFKSDYTKDTFSSVYDLKTDVNATVLQSINENLVNNLDSIVSSTGSQNLFQTVKTDTSGIVVYAVDGYENLTQDQITSSLFDKKNYTKQNLKAEELIVADKPAYKLITSEEWSVIIPLTQEDIDKNELDKKTAVSIKFDKDNVVTNANIEIINVNGNQYGKLSLGKYMIRYATERFLNIEIMASDNQGLKVPVTSLVEKDFYTIPKEYMTTGGNSNTNGFLVEYTNADNQTVVEFRDADIYAVKDDLCYVKTSDFSPGENIVMTDSATQKYPIGTLGTLTGVYCVNTGYTVFKRVDIIDQNNEYCIVKKGISYGISAYDRIILDGEKTDENVMIY